MGGGGGPENRVCHSYIFSGQPLIGTSDSSYFWSPILKIYIPIDSSSPTDNMRKIFLAVALRLRPRAPQNFVEIFFLKDVVYLPQLSNKFFPQKIVFFFGKL